MTKPIQSFWQLVQTHRIEVPIIQRDYVQGRNNTKSEDIRNSFMSAIKKAIVSDEHPLHLNFIYGKINGIQNARQLERNTNAVKSMLNAVQSYSQSLNLNIDFSILKQKSQKDGTHYTSFIPLDGQQRLTTLYLVHWYLLKRLKNQENLKRLKNFSYKIRPSSRDFCHALIDNPKFEIDLNKALLSKQITNRSWFFLYWKKDPTVRSMLNMLDTIHQQFTSKPLSQEDLETYWQRLTKKDSPVIRFEFLNLEDYDLTDELYIKMNARGKPLTDFENFKAWLMEYVADNNIEIEEELNWKHNLDTKWADLFWSNKGDNFTIDQAYMNFFRNMFQIFYVKTKYKKSDEKSSREVFNNNNDLAIEKVNGRYKSVPNSLYEKLGIIETHLERILTCLNIIATKEAKNLLQKEGSIFFADYEKPILQGFLNGEMSYRDKVKFYAAFKFIEKHQEDLEHDEKKFNEQFRSWMRVFRNLLDNGAKNNVDTIDKFKNTLINVDELIKQSDNLYEHFKTLDNISGFDSPQVKEEVRKAKLIYNDKISESYLLKFEKHDYFRGQINFLLELSNEEQDKFLEYGEKCALIFGHEFKNEDFLLERAFLAKYYYPIPKGRNYDFLSIKEWKKEILATQKLNEFKKLLDDIDRDEEVLRVASLINEMNKIKDSYKKDDWVKLFIEYPAAMKYCEQHRIRVYENAEEVRLLKGIILGDSKGQNRELHSYCLYLKMKREYEESSSLLKEILYHTISGTPKDGVPCAYLNSTISSDDYSYAMDIYFVKGRYNIRFFNRKKQDIEKDIIEKLEKLDFTPDEKMSFYVKNIATMNEVENHLLKVCEDLPHFQIPTP